MLPETETGRPIIRDANPNDGPAMKELLADLGYPLPPEVLSGRIEGLLADPRSRLWVAEAGGVAVGLLFLYFIPQLGLAGDIARISYLAISPEFRGRGLGAALLNKAEALAKKLGCDRIEVHCDQRRIRAHRFYSRENYVESPKYLVKHIEAEPRKTG